MYVCVCERERANERERKNEMYAKIVFSVHHESTYSGVGAAPAIR